MRISDESASGDRGDPALDAVTRRLTHVVVYRRILSWLARDAKEMQAEARAWRLARLFLLLAIVAAAIYGVLRYGA